MAIEIKKQHEQSGKRSVFGIIFGLFWSAISLIFVYFGITSTLKQTALYAWQKVPCEIERFDILTQKGADPQFQPDIRYSYEFQGQSYKGNTFWLEKKGEDLYHTLVERQIYYSDKDSYTCLVNPKNPNESVFERKISALFGALGILLFALLFLSIGIIVLAGSVKKRSPNATKSTSLKPKTVSSDAPILQGIGLILIIISLALTIGVFLPKTGKAIGTKSWLPTTAKVLWSGVKSHKSDDSTTYSVDLFYQYEVDGVTHKSNRYNFFGGSDSNYKAKKRFVSNHPRGSLVDIFYHPKKPWLATAKKPSALWLLMYLIPSILFFFGVLMLKRPKMGNASRTKSSKLFGSTKQHESSVSGKSLRKKSFLGMLLFAAFWNAIWGTIAYFLIGSWEKEDFEWFPVIILGAFALVGLVLVGVAIYRGLQIFGPNYVVEFDKNNITPGARIPLSWKKQGGFGQADDFKIILSCVEIATYRRGTSTYTDLKVVREDVLYETNSARNTAKGTIDMAIPRDAMPTFESSNNKIRWSLFVAADVPRWPDVLDEHVFDVSTLRKNDFSA